MTTRKKLEKLAGEKNTPCVTISLNTHRTFPDNTQDTVMLKNLLKEAEDRVIAEFGKRPVAALLEKIQNVTSEIDENYNLDSLHLFLSNDTKEIIKLTRSSDLEGVHISDSFAMRSVINAYNRSESYLVMVLSQSGVQLYEALNDSIVKEIKNEDFPFSETHHFNENKERVSHAKHLDDLVREYLNKVDKALIKVHHETELNCIVVCTEDNYSRLQQVADQASVYLGHSDIDYNHLATHQIAQQTWEMIEPIQKERTRKTIAEIKEAVASGTVLTDLQEIYQASVDGRGDILVVHQNFRQPVLISGNRNFEQADDTGEKDVTGDIISNIAWEVMSKKGRVIFTDQEELLDLGEIVLKTRY